MESSLSLELIFSGIAMEKIDRNACGWLDDSQVTGTYIHIFGTALSENWK